MWSTFTGRLTEFELKNPPWDFHGLKNTCSFTCKPTTKSIESCVYFTDFFWGISIFNTCSYGELFTGVSPIVGIVLCTVDIPKSCIARVQDTTRHWPCFDLFRRHPPPPSEMITGGGGDSYKLWRCLSVLKRCTYQFREAEKVMRFSNPRLSKWMRRLPSPRYSY